MDINTLIARRVRELRDVQSLSLDELAKRSGVSRSNISLIERGESSPTAVVLDKLAAGLHVTLASLFESSASSAVAPSPVSRQAEQVVWMDPASGYLRRNVSPAAPSPMQLVEVVFPPGQRVAYDGVQRAVETHQQLWLLAGAMEVTVSDARWRLDAGDCLVMRLDSQVVYFNPGVASARYLLALVTLPYLPTRRVE